MGIVHRGELRESPDHVETGLQLAETLRASAPNLRVIITTGYNPEGTDLHQAANLGITCLTKPFQPETLTATTQACLERQ